MVFTWRNRSAVPAWRKVLLLLCLAHVCSAAPAQNAQIPQIVVGPGQQSKLPASDPLPTPSVILPPSIECPIPPGGAEARLPALTVNPQVQKEYAQFVERTVDPENVLELIVGIRKLLIFKDPPKRVQMDDDKIVEKFEVSPRELSLVGKKVGKTVLNLWFADPKAPNKERILSYLIRVMPDVEMQRRETDRGQEERQRYYKGLEQQINCAFPDSRVCLTLIGTNLVVSGQARDAIEATQIMRILNPRAGVRSNNTTTVVTEQSLLGSQTIIVPPTSEPGVPNEQTRGLPKAEVIPAQFRQDPAAPAQVQAQIQAQPSATEQTTASQGQTGVNVINQLRIPGEHQVMLKVVVAEVNRAATRSLGLNFSITNSQGVTVFSNRTGGLLNAGSGSGTGGGTGGGTGMSVGGNLPALLDNGKIGLAINALKTLNLARSLAEPNIVALNGQTASFRAGGEFPVPVVTGFTAAGLQGVSFVPFGVQVSFVPTVTDKDRIRLSMNARVSTLDAATSATVSGTNVPGLNERTVTSVVELRDGQTLAIAGLIQNNFSANYARVPFIGDLPGIGQFTGTNNTSSAEQELIMLVTPVLVHPLDHKETPPIPGADIFEPSDIEFYLHGRLESRRPYDYRTPAMTDIHRMRRYHRCEQAFIIGPSGHSDGKE